MTKISKIYFLFYFRFILITGRNSKSLFLLLLVFVLHISKHRNIEITHADWPSRDPMTSSYSSTIIASLRVQRERTSEVRKRKKE